jgi:putative aldouronate transport system substrate-binding protein
MKSKTVKKAVSFIAVLFVSAVLYAGGGTQRTTGGAGQTLEILWAINNQGTGVVPQSDGVVVKRIEELFNVKLKFFPSEYIHNQEQFTLMLASGDIPDVWYDWGNNQWYNQGIIKPISEELIAKNMPYYYNNILLKQDPNKQSLSRRKVAEGYIGVPSVTLDGRSAFYRIYRQDWLDNLGLKVPATLDELETVLRAFTFNDPDRNGKNDTYGWFIEKNQVLFGDVFGAFGVQPYQWILQNDKVIYANITEGYKQGLKYIARWYKGGLLNPEFITDTEEKWTADFVDSKYGSYYMNWWWTSTGNASSPVALLLAKGGSAKVVNGNAVKGPAGLSSAYGYGPDLGWTVVFNYKLDNTKLERIMQIIDWMQHDEGMVLGNMGIEGTTFRVDANGATVTLLNMEEQVKQGINVFPLWSTDEKLKLQYGNSQVMNDFQFGVDQPWLGSVIAGTPLVETSEAGIGIDLGSIYDKYFLDAVTGQIDIDSTWDAHVRQCYAAGLTEQTAEAQKIYDTNFR